MPEIDRDKREVNFDVLVDPGRRVYVRRINVSGNARTRDEVVRREMRQYEDAWYDSDKIRLSRERIGRLGYFTDVRVDTVPVPDAPDQVDLSVSRHRTADRRGHRSASASPAPRSLILSASLNQQNFLGTGKSLGLQINTSKVNRTIVLAHTDPYFTPDGISRTFDVYTANLSTRTELNLGDYKWRTSGIGLRFGVPYTEFDRISFGLSATRPTSSTSVRARRSATRSTSRPSAKTARRCSATWAGGATRATARSRRPEAVSRPRASSSRCRWATCATRGRATFISGTCRDLQGLHARR